MNSLQAQMFQFHFTQLCLLINFGKLQQDRCCILEPQWSHTLIQYSKVENLYTAQNFDFVFNTPLNLYLCERSWTYSCTCMTWMFFKNVSSPISH